MIKLNYSDALKFIAPSAIAFLSAYFAWHLDAPAALLAVPLVYRYSTSRFIALNAFLMYYLVGSYDLIEICRQFMGWNYILCSLAWLFWSVLLSVPVLLFYGKGAWRFPLILATIILPPIGVFGWLNPLLVSGFILPGWGLTGLFMTLVLFAFVSDRHKSESALIVATIVIACSFIAKHEYTEDNPKFIDEWDAITLTSGGTPKDYKERFARFSVLKKNSLESASKGKKVVILPEDIGGYWDGSSSWLWESVQKKIGDSTILVGFDYPKGDGGFDDALVQIDKRGMVKVAEARVPMPGGNWRPWDKESDDMKPLANGVVDVRGRKVMFSFCFEDFLIWPSLVTAIKEDRPEVIVSVANNWFTSHGNASVIQARSIKLTSMMYGIPLLRSVNYAGKDEV